MSKIKISVVYITNGKNPTVLNKCIESAKFADEIIVVGNTELVEHNVLKIHNPSLADAGMISQMRNIGAELASGDIIINADDDILFPPRFNNRLRTFIRINKHMQSFTTKVIGINGSRYWDRAVHDAYGNSFMIDYQETHPDLYYSGAFVVRTKSFADTFKWDNNLKYYQKEDVEFSSRIKQAGHSIKIDTKNYVVHVDSTYIAFRNGENVLVCEKINAPIQDIQEKEFREINQLSVKYQLT